MSDFTVLRSLDGYCLVLDKKRIAGGKPDYRGENVLVDWTTEVVYGPVDDLAAENAKLRELVQKMMRFFEDGDYCTACEKVAECDAQEEYDDSCLMRGVFHDRMRELGVEV